MAELKHSLVSLNAQFDMDFRRTALIKIIVPLVRGPRVLDAGCGMGFMTKALTCAGYRVTAMDMDVDFVRSAINGCRESGALPEGVLYSGGILPFADGSFDTLITLDVIEHVEDDLGLLREFARVLSPTGRLILSVPALSWLYGQRDVALGHYRRYDKALLKSRLDAVGFNILQLNYWNFLGVVPYLASEKILRRPVVDVVRQGRPTRLRMMAAKTLSNWLVLERGQPLPFGLSLISIASKQGSA